MASTAVLALRFLALVAANGSMIVLVVVFGDVLCKYSFSFAFTLALWGTAFFYMLFALQQRRMNIFKCHAYSGALGLLHRQAFLNGLSWSCNYVFLLLANPNVSGFYQVVINESTLVVVFLISQLLLGNRYHRRQWFAFALVMLGGLIPLLKSESGDQNQPGWILLYALGSWAIGFANTITENVMRNAYSADGPGSTNREYHVDPAQYLCLTNLYSIPLVLALAWVPRLAQGPEWAGYFARGMGCLWAGICPTDDFATCPNRHGSPAGVGIMAAWISATLSFVCAFIAAYIQRKRDVVLVTVAYTIAPVFSLVIFMLRLVMVNFYKEPTSVEIWANIVTLCGGILYKVITLWLEDLEPKETWLVRMFKISPQRPLL